MGREYQSIPVNSVLILAKFDNLDDRTKVINSKEYNEGLALITKAIVAGNGELMTKTSKN